MTLSEQGKLVSMWHAYLGGASHATHARSVDMVSFYFDIVRESSLHQVGSYIEVFDVLINGPFDQDAVSRERFKVGLELKSDAA